MLTTEIQLRKLVRSLWRMGGRAFFQTKLPQWICRRGAVGLPISFTSRTPEPSFQRTYFWGPQVPSLQDIANLQFHHKQPARPKKKSRSWGLRLLTGCLRFCLYSFAGCKVIKKCPWHHRGPPGRPARLPPPEKRFPPDLFCWVSWGRGGGG